MTSEARSRIIDMISQRLGFSFREEDLPPKLRKKIGLIAQREELYDQISSQIGRKKTIATQITVVILFFLFLGLFMVLLAVWFGVAFMLVAIVGYLALRREKTLTKDMESEATSLRSEIDTDVDELSESAYNELSLLHEARVRPTIKHLMLDFADIIQAVKGKGIILSTIECPYCKGAVEIPESGEYFKCKYCGKTIYATKIFDKLKDMLSPTD